ncbi:asparagine synthase [Advenella kashmirensis WT001]|uniref:asparagine synthase (glutamine-hydrolyzing) n=1 Tax=Advenella kashmirensis (strain DSM 17095 / LMG 22695 / WT001) TaxID=1036672 RepID=I3UFP6_ADVKW|nr:asparagine synthase (glutamine-hydrolyzing) [Advenella kashmirensis]AFK63834.1 asparagine synthase [Advenella kashmirensis WT001]
MCGIVGLVGRFEHKETLLAQSCDRIAHRGPDSHGFWEEADSGVAFGHVRLAIQDLSEQGHQPMASADQRFMLVFNGEIYNHPQLRQALEQDGYAHAWRGHSDTETILAGLMIWGVQETLKRMVGMFAIAVWDRQTRNLVLARDRFGEKPLYYGYTPDGLMFASELKALMPLPGFDAHLNRDAIALFLRHNYIPAPYSVFTKVRKLLPGTWVSLSADQIETGAWPEPVSYWSALEVARSQPRAQFARDDDAVDGLDRVLRQAIRGQLLSDVPLGAFLSGGIDSSLIASLTREEAAGTLKTFSIGFTEPEYNEAEYAAEVARHLGTDHTELYVSAQDSLDLIPSLPQMYDEPFADSSQIPTALVMRMARQQVTVALSGDAGDELFGGYSRYQRVQQWWGKRERVPAGLQGPLRAGARVAASLLSGPRAEKFGKLEQVLGAENMVAFYRQFVSYWQDPASVLKGATEPDSAFSQAPLDSLLDTMMAIDTVSYLPDDILVKVDRAAMAVSLETRVPLLDHRVYEFAWSLDEKYKLRGGDSKWILKQLLYRHVPQQMLDRPKKGFSVPMGQWLRGPLRQWGEQLLALPRLEAQNLLDAQRVREVWMQHQSGQVDNSARLWGILMLQAWLDEYGIKP